MLHDAQVQSFVYLTHRRIQNFGEGGLPFERFRNTQKGPQIPKGRCNPPNFGNK